LKEGGARNQDCEQKLKKMAEEGNGRANAHKTTNGHLMEWMTVIFAGSILLDENFGLVDDNRM